MDNLSEAFNIINDIATAAHQNTITMIEKEGRPICIIEKYLDTRIKNDPILVRQILRVCFSAYSNNPINLGVLAPTSEGKTYATVQVTDLFPASDVIAVARLSPTALIHQNGILVDENGDAIGSKLDDLHLKMVNAKKNDEVKLFHTLEAESKDLIKNARNMVDLSNKILLFLDNPNPATYEMLKPLLSHDKYELLFKITKTDGSLNVKESIIRGWPATIVCSAKNEAKNEVWPEIQSRFFMTSPNTDVKKYKAANSLTGDIMGIPTWASHIHTSIENKEYCKFFIQNIKEGIVKICKGNNNPIFNPYREKIVDLLPNVSGIDMRHFSRFNAFLNMETILHANENVMIEFITKSEERHVSIITSIEDIDNTTTILKEISTLPPEKIKFFDKVFKNAILENLDSYSDSYGNGSSNNNEENVSLTSKELAIKYTSVFKKPTTAKKIVESYLEPLVDEGLLESKPNPDNKKQNYYSLGSLITIHDLSTLKSKILDSIDCRLPQIDNGHSRRNNCRFVKSTIIDNHPLYIWLGVAKLGQLSTQFGKITKLFDKNGPLNFLQFIEKIK